MNPRWLDTLARQRDTTTQAVAFKPDRCQPLVALYSTSILPVAAQRIQTADRSLQANYPEDLNQE